MSPNGNSTRQRARSGLVVARSFNADSIPGPKMARILASPRSYRDSSCCISSYSGALVEGGSGTTRGTSLTARALASGSAAAYRRFGKTAAERPESLESDLNLGIRVDEVVVVKAGTVGDGAEAHHGAGLDGAMNLNQANTSPALWLISDVDPWYLSCPFTKTVTLRLYGSPTSSGVTR